MTDKLTTKIEYFLILYMDNFEPNWFLFFGLTTILIVFLGLSPLQEDREMSSLDIIALWSRRAVLAMKVALISGACAYIFIGYLLLNNEFSNLLFGMIDDWWIFMISIIITSIYIKFLCTRYLSPKLSRALKNLRVTQKIDELSDISKELGKYRAIAHLPEKWEKQGHFFSGISMNGSPQYIDENVWTETHKAVVGATRYGKGLIYQVWSQQSIKRNHTVFMINPKEDKFLPKILEQEAIKAGRRFIYLDLREAGKGKWAPFAGGSAIDRRTRFYTVMNMLSTGGDADHYKALARSVIFDIFKEGSNHSLRSISQAIENSNADEDHISACSTVKANLKEWLERSTFNPSKKGFSIERSLTENAVVYVQGDLNDHVVKSATIAFIIELIQEAQRLVSDRKEHLSIYIDELRFLMSKPVFDALATIAGYDVDLSVAFQSFGDLKNPDDRNLDGKALLASVQTNCQVKVFFKVDDKETAEFASETSGTKQKSTVKFERTDINKAGGENWHSQRTIGDQEEALITPNAILAFPKKVAAFYRPNHLAEIICVDAVPLETKTNMVEAAQ
ncbi:TraM recognition domain-containing protein [Kiloniella laminariae]|uniref:TraM recognition domain-containing protein n=1 Tax=Kiloniella laminariae TaxID=454162 RepID=A0ABT4LPL5_9PROT|nr:type IV secretory system conjugative DNA transfer family protein [Kiloniella laminariae]MCZ4283075.1 TraM recognition domain-containing protein [Kiloniella laminariae]